jgi:predicted restriction endonuclease
VLHWGHGGATNLDNMVLLCHRHHWSVHEGGWQLVTTDKRRVLAIPPTFAHRSWTRAPDGVALV